MLVKINQVLKGINGKELETVEQDETGANKKVNLTLSTICVNALMSQDDKATGTEKLARFKLAEKISNVEGDGEIELTVEQISKIKDRIDKTYPMPLIVGRAWEALDPVKDIN